jgi:hypothetical protein
MDKKEIIKLLKKGEIDKIYNRRDMLNEEQRKFISNTKYFKECEEEIQLITKILDHPIYFCNNCESEYDNYTDFENHFKNSVVDCNILLEEMELHEELVNI